jgi:hypothetical protein
MKSDYIKQLEESNHILRERLDKAQTIVDRLHENPLEESLTLLIEASLKHQKVARKISRVIRTNEISELRLFLPRQIGLSTCIVKACRKFFDEVHILDTTMSGRDKNKHKSVNDIPMDVSCIIVDPWSVKYSKSRDWNAIREKLWDKFDKTKPFLLILAG